jgi:receptor protein-tyrosine kinase
MEGNWHGSEVYPLTVKRFTPTVMHPAKPSARLLFAHDPYDSRCEKIRGLRTELLLRREAHGEADVIALLSPDVGDGRSQLAAELALAFAQLGRPTLLVDADLRQPSQHILFNAPNQVGLVQAIERNEHPFLHSVDGFRQLSLLTAGPPPDNPLELLLNSRFAALVAEWRQNFDFVIVDTPPIGSYSDGLAVASLVRRVLALCRAKSTPYRENRDMLRRLAAMRAQVVGAVINHF